MSSKSTTSKYSTTASELGTNFGKNSSKTDEGEVLTAVGDNGSGEEPVMETGKVGLGMSSETRQAIHGLLVSLHKVKPNQSARSLLNGDAQEREGEEDEGAQLRRRAARRWRGDFQSAADRVLW